MFAYTGVGYRDVLRQVVGEIISPLDCTQLSSIYMWRVTDNMLCVRYKEAGQNFCSMVSGSSLVCRQGNRWWQHSFTSWGVSNCGGKTQVEVHSNVVKYLPWIEHEDRGQFWDIYWMVHGSSLFKLYKESHQSPLDLSVGLLHRALSTSLLPS